MGWLLEFFFKRWIRYLEKRKEKRNAEIWVKKNQDFGLCFGMGRSAYWGQYYWSEWSNGCTLQMGCTCSSLKQIPPPHAWPASCISITRSFSCRRVSPLLSPLATRWVPIWLLPRFCHFAFWIFSSEGRWSWFSTVSCWPHSTVVPWVAPKCFPQGDHHFISLLTLGKLTYTFPSVTSALASLWGQLRSRERGKVSDHKAWNPASFLVWPSSSYISLLSSIVSADTEFTR